MMKVKNKRELKCLRPVGPRVSLPGFQVTAATWVVVTETIWPASQKYLPSPPYREGLLFLV